MHVHRIIYYWEFTRQVTSSLTGAVPWVRRDFILSFLHSTMRGLRKETLERRRSTTWRTTVLFTRILMMIRSQSFMIVSSLTINSLTLMTPQGNKGAFLSPLVSACLAVHLKKTINNVIQYGYPVGALAIATAVVC